jgi:hypothetical protein
LEHIFLTIGSFFLLDSLFLPKWSAEPRSVNSEEELFISYTCRRYFASFFSSFLVEERLVVAAYNEFVGIVMVKKSAWTRVFIVVAFLMRAGGMSSPPHPRLHLRLRCRAELAVPNLHRPFH